MNARFYDRLAATVSIALLLMLAGGSYFLAEVAQRFIQPGAVREGPDVADAFGEAVVLMRLNAAGEPVFRMSAERLEHFRRSDITTYSRPALATLEAGQSHLTVTAMRGSSRGESRETQLEGDVRFVRPAKAGEPALLIRTESVRVFSDTEIALTDRPVAITRGQSTLTGTGMEFNNQARTLRVDSAAKAVWSPEQRP